MEDKEIECMINRNGTSYAFAKLAPLGEIVEYMNGYEEKEEVIKNFLIEKALEW